MKLFLLVLLVATSALGQELTSTQRSQEPTTDSRVDVSPEATPERPIASPSPRPEASSEAPHQPPTASPVHEATSERYTASPKPEATSGAAEQGYTASSKPEATSRAAEQGSSAHPQPEASSQATSAPQESTPQSDASTPRPEPEATTSAGSDESTEEPSGEVYDYTVQIKLSRRRYMPRPVSGKFNATFETYRGEEYTVVLSKEVETIKLGARYEYDFVTLPYEAEDLKWVTLIFAEDKASPRGRRDRESNLIVQTVLLVPNYIEEPRNRQRSTLCGNIGRDLLSGKIHSHKFKSGSKCKN